MFFEQFYLQGLGHASYLVGSEETGEALLFDPQRLDDVPRTGRPLAVACGSGYRSSVAASLLDARTDLDVVNVLGGMSAWRAAGYPIKAA